jgi:hypothetical protein
VYAGGRVVRARVFDGLQCVVGGGMGDSLRERGTELGRNCRTPNRARSVAVSTASSPRSAPCSALMRWTARFIDSASVRSSANVVTPWAARSDKSSTCRAVACTGRPAECSRSAVARPISGRAAGDQGRVGNGHVGVSFDLAVTISRGLGCTIVTRGDARLDGRQRRLASEDPQRRDVGDDGEWHQEGRD